MMIDGWNSSNWQKSFLQRRNTISCQGWHLSKSESGGWLETHKALSFMLLLLGGKGLSRHCAVCVSLSSIIWTELTRSILAVSSFTCPVSMCVYAVCVHVCVPGARWNISDTAEAHMHTLYSLPLSCLRSSTGHLEKSFWWTYPLFKSFIDRCPLRFAALCPKDIAWS